MIYKSPLPDRILVAELTGEARHRAKWRPLTQDETAAAVGELQALAGGRADLLAEVTGIFEGTSEGELDEPLARCAARLCRRAGADPEAIPGWVDDGRRRRANASKPPFSGGVSGPGLRFPWFDGIRHRVFPTYGHPEGPAHGGDHGRP